MESEIMRPVIAVNLEYTVQGYARLQDEEGQERIVNLRTFALYG